MFPKSWCKNSSGTIPIINERKTPYQNLWYSFPKFSCTMYVIAALNSRHTSPHKSRQSWCNIIYDAFKMMFQLTRHSFFDFTRRKTPITLIVVFPGGIFDKTPPRDIDRHSTVSHGEGKYIHAHTESIDLEELSHQITSNQWNTESFDKEEWAQ